MSILRPISTLALVIFLMYLPYLFYNLVSHQDAYQNAFGSKCEQLIYL